MRLLYSGSSFCSNRTFKRLALVAEELVFSDYPSVVFGNWGTIAHDSYARRVNWEGCPVKVSAVSPPSGLEARVFKEYAETDLANLEFRKAVWEGMLRSDEFCDKFIQLEGNYGDGKTGKDIVKKLRLDSFPDAALPRTEDIFHDGFNIDRLETRRAIFANIVVSASIATTSALSCADEVEAAPITENPYFSRLLARRISDRDYVGDASMSAPYLGLSFVKSVIPEQLIDEVSLGEILDYREKASDAYSAWITEISKSATLLADYGSIPDPTELHRIVSSELAPKLVEYENEMKSIRDDFFAEGIKKVSKYEFPALSIAYLTGLGFTEALAIFIAAMAPAAPSAADYIKNRARVKRENSASYLLNFKY